MTPFHHILYSLICIVLNFALSVLLGSAWSRGGSCCGSAVACFLPVSLFWDTLSAFWRRAANSPWPLTVCSGFRALWGQTNILCYTWWKFLLLPDFIITIRGCVQMWHKKKKTRAVNVACRQAQGSCNTLTLLASTMIGVVRKRNVNLKCPIFVKLWPFNNWTILTELRGFVMP